MPDKKVCFLDEIEESQNPRIAFRQEIAAYIALLQYFINLTSNKNFDIVYERR